MRILHFSDLHMTHENDIDFKHFIVNPFLQDLRKEKEKTQFDMICLTGDIVDKGARGFEQREKWADTFRACPC